MVSMTKFLKRQKKAGKMALWVKTLVTQWCKPDLLCDLSLSLCVCVSLCLFLRVCVSLPLCVSLLSVSHSKRKTKKDTESVRAVHSKL